MKLLVLYSFFLLSFGLASNVYSEKLDDSDRNLDKIHRAIVYDINFYKNQNINQSLEDITPHLDQEFNHIF